MAKDELAEILKMANGVAEKYGISQQNALLLIMAHATLSIHYHIDSIVAVGAKITSIQDVEQKDKTSQIRR